MKISTRARYALRCMVFIARNGKDGEPVSLERVSKYTQISRRYLEQLAISLRNGSLVRSVSGRKGGYLLAQPPDQITIAQIVEAAIGPVNVVDCVLKPEICDKAGECESRMIYAMINARINEVLNEYTLADISSKDWIQKAGREFASIGSDGSFLDTFLDSCPEKAANATNE